MKPRSSRKKKPPQHCCVVTLDKHRVPVPCVLRVFKRGHCLGHYKALVQLRALRRARQAGHRAEAEFNAHGRITPPVVARYTPGEARKPYVRKRPAAIESFEREAAAVGKRYWRQFLRSLAVR